MNITILIDPKQYSYHSSIAHFIEKSFQNLPYVISILDIRSEKYDYLCLNKLHSFQPKVLITLDLAGFQFHTQAGENALNMLPTKNLNLIWGDKYEYTDLLSKKISLSMIFYDATGRNNSLSRKYPNLQYYKSSELYTLDTSLSGVDSKDHFLNIWKDFIDEVLLSEA